MSHRLWYSVAAGATSWAILNLPELHTLIRYGSTDLVVFLLIPAGLLGSVLLAGNTSWVRRWVTAIVVLLVTLYYMIPHRTDPGFGGLVPLYFLAFWMLQYAILRVISVTRLHEPSVKHGIIVGAIASSPVGLPYAVALLFWLFHYFVGVVFRVLVF